MAWKASLFGCLANPQLSILACVLCPLSVGKNAEFVGDKHPILWVIAVQMLPCLGGALLRREIRKTKKIEGSFYFDLCAWLLCPCCAVCQEARETAAMEYLIPPETQILEREPEQSATA